MVDSTQVPAPMFQGIVLSGGGARGPYGAGVLRALNKYQAERTISAKNFYCGTSVGALNATLAAQGDLEKLTALYSSLRTHDVIGASDSDISQWKVGWSADRDPYYYFSNKNLKGVIGKAADFSKLVDSNLLICATNYDTGELETFYVSKEVDHFLTMEAELPFERRRLDHYHRITSQEMLVDALLASAAVPFFFSPIKIGGSTYIDGGIGNNTPTRQAAYFCRFLAKSGRGRAEPLICVINDPVSSALEIAPGTYQLSKLIQRTIDIFQNELVHDTLLAWDRINKEVEHVREQERQILKAIEERLAVHQSDKDALAAAVKSVMSTTTAATPRLSLDIMQVRPTAPLPATDLLTFDPAVSVRLMQQGIADCLNALSQRGVIGQRELGNWVQHA